MNTTPPNVPNPNNNATPKKRSVVKTILFILWLIIAIGCIYFIAMWPLLIKNKGSQFEAFVFMLYTETG